MYVTSGSTCYHHLKVSSIRQVTRSDGTDMVVINGGTKLLQRDPTTEKGFKVVSTKLSLIVEGYLQEYVINEIDEGDNIFVCCYPVSTPEETAYGVRHVMKYKAEAIYKEDFLNYFPREWRTVRNIKE